MILPKLPESTLFIHEDHYDPLTRLYPKLKTRALKHTITTLYERKRPTENYLLVINDNRHGIWTPTTDVHAQFEVANLISMYTQEEPYWFYYAENPKYPYQIIKQKYKPKGYSFRMSTFQIRNPITEMLDVITKVEKC